MKVHVLLLRLPDGTGLIPRDRVALQREVARKALRRCAQECGAPEEGWRQDEDSVPQPNQGWCWSISHKREWAAAAISREPVGVDVEKIAPRRESMLDEIAEGWEWGQLGGKTWEGFFRLWTAKEATLKANGVGISGLGECRLAKLGPSGSLEMEFRGRRFTVSHFDHDGHVVGVTAEPNSVRWRVLDDRAGERCNA